MVSTVDCEPASMDSSSIVRPKEDSIRVTWEDIKFPPINLWSAPRLSQDSPSPEEHSLMVKRRSLLTVKYEKLESDRNRQCDGSSMVEQSPHKTLEVGSIPTRRTKNLRGYSGDPAVS